MECKICNKIFTNSQSLSKHLSSKHNISAKDYYDTYLKLSNEGICLTCNRYTKFLNITKGYQKHCNSKCAQLDPNCNNFIKDNPQKNPEIQNKTKQTLLNRYNVTSPAKSNIIKQKMRETCLSKYGVTNIYCKPNVQILARNNSHSNEANNKRISTQYNHIRQIAKQLDAIFVQDLLKQTKSSGWYQCGIVNTIKYNNYVFIKNEDIQKVLDYDSNAYKVYSLNEKKIVEAIKANYSGIIIENSKKIIAPKELDIYLPDLNLAIEYNGIYFHSSLANCPTNYHLTKSLLCRQKNIRLIHIYEFENLSEQISLVLSLINGNDLYKNNDFNKNNLIANIPKPEIIFNDGRLIVYGAGFLI